MIILLPFISLIFQFYFYWDFPKLDIDFEFAPQ